MRASTDQVRDLTLDVVDGARKRASEVVTHGADRVASTFDGAASTIGDGVERLAERVPVVGVKVEPHKTHRLRTLLLLVAAVAVIAAVARKLTASPAEERSSSASPSDNGDRAARDKDGASEKDADTASDDSEPLDDANVADD